MEKRAHITKSLKLFDKSLTIRELVFLACLILCLFPFVSPPIALTMGIVIAQFVGHPYINLNHKATQLLLQFSVVGLGFGMNAKTALQAGKDGILFTLVSIVGVLIFGYILGKLLKTDKKTSFLISTGTAICGGSAIAAISPVIKAEDKQISVALGTIFVLNALAIFIFPFIGHLLSLSQHDFGLWCAIAIQDTSSVVGAANKFGSEALEIATAVKLTRALWIIPLAVISSLIFKNKNTKIKIPYFIGLFVLAIVCNSYFPVVVNNFISGISKTGLTLTLFLIGAGLSGQVLRGVGIKPFLQGILLWLIIAIPSLLIILIF